jgi:hypothetical protein
MNLDDQLTRAWNARWSQDQVLWRIFGAFWPTNAILLAALFRSGGNLAPRRYAIITCAVGVFVAAAWFLIQRRAFVHITRLERIAENLERELLVGDAAKYALSPDYNSEDSRHGRPVLTARRVVPVCIFLVGVAWLIGFSISWFCLPAA